MPNTKGLMIMNNNLTLNADLSRRLAESIAANPPRPMMPTFIEESERRTEEILDGIDKVNRERDARENAKLEALQKTARETQEIRERQDKIIDNLQKLIDYKKEQIEALSQQLQVLKNLFASGEDGVAVQKEIMQMIIDQEKDKHPIREYLADKGGDLGVAAITAATPWVWSGIKAWLATQGIVLP